MRAYHAYTYTDSEATREELPQYHESLNSWQEAFSQGPTFPLQYIYIIYTPNLEWANAVFDQEREQGRKSSEGARGRSKGASREHQRSTGSAAQKKPKLAAL